MPDVPQLNIRRDFGTPPKDKIKTVYKPLSYRKHAKNDIKPTDFKLPHPFKCSRCDFTGENRDTLNRHYFSWH